MAHLRTVARSPQLDDKKLCQPKTRNSLKIPTGQNIVARYLHSAGAILVFSSAKFFAVALSMSAGFAFHRGGFGLRF
jgi:hypothetical protein